ncbi:MAG TPA: TolC family protein [Elusimicrobiota bacterium]|nr:TolC family protein [Elusimicrobiota bacterium]
MRTTLAFRAGFLLALCAASPAAAQAPLEKSFSLDDAVRLAELNNADILSARQAEIIAEERVKEAEYLFLPEVGLQATATHYDSRYPFAPTGNDIILFPNTFLNQPGLGIPTGNIYSGYGYLTMSLYEGGRTLNTLRMAEAAQKQAFNNEESVKMRVILETKKVFYNLLLAQQTAAAWADYAEQTEKLAARSPKASWKYLEAQADMEYARIQASAAEHDLALARLAFLKNLNLEMDTSFSVDGSLETKPVSMDIERAVLWALELRPELQAQTYQAQMDAISVNLALARRSPTVFVAGDYGVTGFDFPLQLNNWDTTIGVRIPFTYDYWSQIKEKQAEQRQGDIQRSELQDRVRVEVRQAYETLQYWQKEYPIRRDEYLKFQALYARLKKEKPQDTLDRIDSLKNLTEMRLSYLDAVTRHILAEAELERAVGRSITP